MKRILVALDGSAFSRAAQDYACHLAKAEQAQLTGIAIIDLPGIERSIGPVPLGASAYAAHLKKHKVHEAKAEAREVLKTFGQTCWQRRVRARVLTKEGVPFSEIVEESKYNDLVIIGLKTFFRYGAMKEPGDTLRKLLRHGIRPVLAVPDRYRPVREILVAYDGSTPAAKAAHQLVQSGLWRSRKVTVLTVSEDRHKGNELLGKLSEYFQGYGVKVKQVLRRGDPAEIILSYAVRSKADLLVIGTHGRDNIRGFFFGSVTKRIVEEAHLPLFICH